MNDNEVAVKIVGDASGVAPAVDVAKGSIEGLSASVQALNATMAGMAAKMKAGMDEGAAATNKLKESMHGAKAATEAESNALVGMVHHLHEAAESVRTFQMRAKEFAEVYVAAFAVEQIVEFAKHMGEAAEKVKHLSEEFGMSVPEVQKLQGVATATGIPIDSITRGMAILSKNAVTAGGSSSALGNALKSVGVASNDGKTSMERLLSVADKFKNMEDGPKKLALSMLLFGKSGKELIPVLNQGRQGLEEINKKTAEYGAVSATAIEKGAALAESINEGKLAFQGVSNVLMDALAPMLKEIADSVNVMIAAFIKSYKEGGIVAQVFQFIKQVIGEVGAVINVLIDVFSELWSAVSEIMSALGSMFSDIFGVKTPGSIQTSIHWLNIFKDTMTVIKDVFIMCIEVMKAAILVLVDELKMLAKIADDALHLRWGEIKADWDQGMNHIAKDAENAALRIKNAMAEAAQAIILASKGEAVAGASGGIKAMGGGNGSFDPDLGKSAKGKKPKKDKKGKAGKDDLVQKLNQELEAIKTHWEERQIIQGTAQAFSLEQEAAFWDKAKARTNLSAKDRLEIEKKWVSAHQALQKKAIEQAIEHYKEDLDAAGKNWTAKKAILQKEADYKAKMYGADSKEALAAAETVKQAARSEADQLRAIADDLAKHKQSLALLDVDSEQAAAAHRVAMGRETAGQLLAEERHFEEERHAIRRQALMENLALIDKNRDPAEYQKVSEEIETLEKQHQNKLTELARKAQEERTAVQRQAINGISSAWGGAFSKLITMQASLYDTMKSMAIGIQNAISGALSNMITKWLQQKLSAIVMHKAADTAAGAGEIARVTTITAAKTAALTTITTATIAASTAQATAQIAASKAVAAAVIPTQIGIAGASGVASMAGAPFPMDMTAPAFGASMAAAAASYGSVAAFDVGAWNLSKDQLAVVHGGEMIIPSAMAGGMRELMTHAANGNTKPASNENGKGAGGSNTFHYSPTVNHSDSSLKSMLGREGREFRSWFHDQVRNGAIKTAGA